MDDFENQTRRLIEASIHAKEQLLKDSKLLSAVAEVSRTIVASLQQGGKLFLFGNGGSAADAQHIAAEFVGRFAFDRPALPALALSVNSSCVTAIGNDYGFNRVFSRQIEAFGRTGDVAIGISTSGNSENVLCGLSVAQKLGMKTVGMTGQPGGKLQEACDICLCVPARETPRIQECHILVGHIVSELVEKTLFA